MRVGGGLQANVALPQPVTDSDTDYDEAPIDEEYSGTGKIYGNIVKHFRKTFFLLTFRVETHFQSGRYKKYIFEIAVFVLGIFNASKILKGP